MSIKIFFAILLSIAFVSPSMAGDDEAKQGKKLFETHCLSCHSGLVPEAPKLEAFKLYSHERVVKALNSGVMSVQALVLSNQDIRYVAEYLTGKTAEAKREASTFTCQQELPKVGLDAASWAGWGGPNANQRFQANAGELNRQSVKDLELKWAFAFPDTTRVRSQPTVTSTLTYIGSQEGTVYALDTDTGCVHWTFEAGIEVRGAIALHTHPKTGAPLLLFGDFNANAYAVDAQTGALLWKTQVHGHSLATITGSVTAYQDKVFVPVSSTEVVPASRSSYECCTFRGSLVALNIADGSLVWQTFTTDEPKERGKNSAGVTRFGPSGAPIWSSPTIDGKRNLVLATTGQNYSSPATATSDAVIAMDLDTGKVRWVSQVWKDDAWNGACSFKATNCPEEDGPDFDVGTSAILSETPAGKELIFVGQKSGIVYALDPEQDGKIVWRKRVGKGGTMGGVHWGMSSDGEQLYVGVSDLPTNNRYAVGEPQPGVQALNPDTGEFVWRERMPNKCPKDLKFMCFPGISAAVSSSPGLLFAGGLDGILRAFDSGDGSILWSENTQRPYATVNGVDGYGGAIESDGPVLANGQLFVTSGYDKWAEMPGNVLLVFALPTGKK